MPLPLPSALARPLRILARTAKSERLAAARTRAIRPRTVLYESFGGNGALCNPEAIFRGLLADPDFTDLSHVWAVRPGTADELRAEFAGAENVTFVERDSADYWEALSTARYLINNATFPPQFGKRRGQVYVNTWHGTPLKLMGFDMPGGAWESANTLRNFLSADFLLAANPFMAETMYEGAYQLRNLYQGLIVEEGYPRIDRQRLTDADSRALRSVLSARLGAELADDRIVLFAPTWRGASFASPDADLERLAAQVASLRSELGDGVQVLLKTHQVVHDLAARVPALRDVLVPNSIPSNVLLGAADALVTDYSSIFFDYLATGRPIGFLVPDDAEYEAQRGTYMSLDELPGPVERDASVLGRRLRGLLNGEDPQHPRYIEWAQRFVPFDDGSATARVIDVVFRGRTEGHRVRRAASDDRPRLLLYLGGMRLNGITSSAVNLVNTIDPDRYDVTVLMALPRGAVTRLNQERIDPRVRQVFRIGGMNGPKYRQVLRRLDDRSTDPLRAHAHAGHGRLWQDEWSRIFGAARFDWIADFSGYSPFWAHLMLHSPSAVRAIWLHNEMAADRERKVGGRQPHRRSLGRVFSMYRTYDQLVSVSEHLTALNREELAEFAPKYHFHTVRNLPDQGRFAQLRREGAVADEVAEGEPEPDWLRALTGDTRTVRRFVSVGRLSTEKNHARLIRAFADVHADHPGTQLFIVGGGPLEAELRAQIAAAGLGHAVFLTGAQHNPIGIMDACDCFVLSSEYEGQPMVLLEAAQCELSIVTTAFASARGALPGETMLIVDKDDTALAEGMRAFLRGDVAPSTIDIAQYVAATRGQFAALIPPRSS
ncbi:CDP-glycerol glycerophosphotransferase family protein [Microbacterium fluvii]|uniref:CDP-glycerol glycerophosphotransferase family protein n=1 Tax=Microbacterium fluvii TaxID=415215 RepID=A0ABW2HDL3_9MICO|nr:glycosyltransferase [Microbacterium fluvii]MCU4672214.1 CDP-glycerol glycerophosphotransferase family protein [Microbacterium fluvii]